MNLREELKTTNAVFFPRCLLVKRCGGNCGCGTTNWNNGCTCQASKTTLKLHEVGLAPWRHSHRVQIITDFQTTQHHKERKKRRASYTDTHTGTLRYLDLTVNQQKSFLYGEKRAEKLEGVKGKFAKYSLYCVYLVSNAFQRCFP